MGFALRAAWERLQLMAQNFGAALPSIGLALFTFIVFYIGGRIAKSLVRRATERRGHLRGAGIAMGRLAQGLVLLMGILVALSVALPTFKPGDIIELLGIGSVAIGFAFRDILQNFLAGILILLTRPFRIGDQIVTSTYEGTSRTSRPAPPSSGPMMAEGWSSPTRTCSRKRWWLIPPSTSGGSSTTSA